MSLQSKTRVGVIGYGYWGPNLVRNFIENQDCLITHVADVDTKKHRALRQKHPSLSISDDPISLIESPDIDAVCIATPIHTHYALAKHALKMGKHVLVEKPLAATVDESKELVELALSKKSVLMVDHTFLYTGSVKKIKSLVDSGELGTIQYFDSVRINLGLFQQDSNVVWDLAPHDLSILLYTLGKKPKSLVATGLSHTSNRLENIAYVTLYFDDAFIAHLHCSWISPAKVRKIMIGGSSKMIVYDDVEPTEKIKVYDYAYSVEKAQERHKWMVDYRIGDVLIPKLETTEALSLVVKDFVSAIAHRTQPVSNGEFGVEVVKLLEATNQSLLHRGKEITIR